MFSRCHRNMIVCGAVTQKWVMYNCLFRGRCLATVLHAAICHPLQHSSTVYFYTIIRIHGDYFPNNIMKMRCLLWNRHWMLKHCLDAFQASEGRSFQMCYGFSFQDNVLFSLEPSSVCIICDFTLVLNTYPLTSCILIRFQNSGSTAVQVSHNISGIRVRSELR
jgi:hypothetical protein